MSLVFSFYFITIGFLGHDNGQIKIKLPKKE